MKILGIDPGTRKCGFGIIEKEQGKISLVEAGFINIKQDELKFQILEMSKAFDDIFAKHEIEKISIETMFYSLNPQSVLKLAQFRGALLFKMLTFDKEIYEYAPLTVKKALTGKAQASKEQVAFMVKRLLGIKGDFAKLDISDALALALTCAFNLN